VEQTKVVFQEAALRLLKNSRFQRSFVRA